MADDTHEWTSCEMYGHSYEPTDDSERNTKRCVDCGDIVEVEEDD